MANEVFKSGTGHRVATNEVTKHAINPRHEFSSDKRLIVDDGARSIEKQHLRDDIYHDLSLSTSKNQQLIGSSAQYPEGASSVELREIEKRVTFYEKKARGGYSERVNMSDAFEMRPADHFDSPVVQSLAIATDVTAPTANEAELLQVEQQKPSRALGRFSERLRALKERLQDASDQLARVKSDLE